MQDLHDAATISKSTGGWTRLWGWAEFSGAVLLTVLVKGADFSSIWNTPPEIQNQSQPT
jgi:hypothetical protein